MKDIEIIYILVVITQESNLLSRVIIFLGMRYIIIRHDRSNHDNTIIIIRVVSQNF